MVHMLFSSIWIWKVHLARSRGTKVKALGAAAELFPHIICHFNIPSSVNEQKASSVRLARWLLCYSIIVLIEMLHEAVYSHRLLEAAAKYCLVLVQIWGFIFLRGKLFCCWNLALSQSVNNLELYHHFFIKAKRSCHCDLINCSDEFRCIKQSSGFIFEGHRWTLVVQRLEMLPYSKKAPNLSLCGVCMFSFCLHRFPPSISLKTWMLGLLV